MQIEKRAISDILMYLKCDNYQFIYSSHRQENQEAIFTKKALEKK